MLRIVLYFFLVVYQLISAENDFSCTPLPTQKNTEKLLADLRSEMVKEDISVYVIFSDDEHGSEYTQNFDKRRDWITGFRGSAGIAVVSLQEAALWTDGRYFTQAEEELDCQHWLLMRDGTPGVPNVTSWIMSAVKQTKLPPGVTAVFTKNLWWSITNDALKTVSAELKVVDDLVARIWPKGERPNESRRPILIHDEKYAGETVSQKLNRTAAELRRVGASVAIISALDEVAWLFNLRGADIPYNPFFKSYAIIYRDYDMNFPELFLNMEQFNRTQYTENVRIFDYSQFWSRLNATITNPLITRIWVDPLASQAIFATIPNQKLIRPLQNSPVKRVKARKNQIERKGMRDCQIRDAVARMKHLGWIEDQLNQGHKINETESSEKLLFFQQQQDLFQYPSFSSISASGDRAAVIHYSPSPSTARQITREHIYLLDAGGQYLDCTTDITRTHHFGTPKDLEKRAYTRVLQGVLDIADAVFPVGTYGRSLDHLGRMHLFRDGMVFGHSVGHGIGHFLSVHEGPQRIGSVYSPYEEPLSDGMFLSDEPGYYKAGDFGIRIENDMEVVLTNRSMDNRVQFLRFETITYVPYERSLIDIDLLSREHYDAINNYHEKVFKTLEPLLENDTAALNALRSRTAKLEWPASQKHDIYIRINRANDFHQAFTPCLLPVLLASILTDWF